MNIVQRAAKSRVLRDHCTYYGVPDPSIGFMLKGFVNPNLNLFFMRSIQNPQSKLNHFISERVAAS
jgi:hypothetical protein